jgi:hypothetical protein
MMPSPSAVYVRLWMALCAWLAVASGAEAQDVSSAYTAFNLDHCVIVEKIEQTGSIVQRCRALDGFPVFIAEDDLRFFVGYGPHGRKQKSFSQTLPQFNSIHNKIEFRIRSGARQPFAAILRYFTDSGAGKPKGQVLVVTKIDSREACHMAYIDAVANPEANTLAQKTADTLAPNFVCGRDEPKNIGAVGPGRM